MDHDWWQGYTEQEDTIRCTLCGTATNLGNLCHCCHRCIDCISECGHSRMRIVADEIEYGTER